MDQARATQRLTIGRLADRAGVGVETIRYYERRGLLDRPPRSEGGFRRYSPEAVRKVRFIKRAQQLGFTLNEIADLLDLRLDPAPSCNEVRPRARAKLADIDRKLSDLKAIRRALADLLDACDGRGPAEPCPILEALDTDDEPRGEP